jgi:hypothetical protein
LFSEANAFLDSVNRYETVLVAAHRNPLLTSNGTRRVADLTFEEAAGGFGSADRMRIVFSTRLGVTPVQYRASSRRAESD